VIARLLSWWRRDDRMARHATHAAIRAEMGLHPVEKGEHHDNVPVVPPARAARVSDVRPARLPALRLRRSYQAPWPAR